MEAHFMVTTIGDLAGMDANTKVLIPLGNESIDRLKKQPIGKHLRGFFRLLRNYEFLKKAHALIRFAFDCQEAYDDVDEFRHAVTIEAGFSRERKLLNGTVEVVAKSWAFDNMDEQEFADLYNAMIRAMLRHSHTVFNGVDPHVFERQLSNFAGDSL